MDEKFTKNNFSKGALGCLLSHIEIIKIAKKNKLDIGSEESINKVIELITNKDIEETVEYFSKKK